LKTHAEVTVTKRDTRGQLCATGSRLMEQLGQGYLQHPNRQVIMNDWNARHALPLRPASNTANGLAVCGQTPQI